MEYEVYVLCEARSSQLANLFLDTFLPNRVPAAVDFPVPECANEPRLTFYDPEALIAYLELAPSEVYGVYWNTATSDNPRMAMLFFTNDARMIAGLVCCDADSVSMLSQLAAVVGGSFGFIDTECRPPDSATNFIDLCRRSAAPTIVNGRLIT